MRPVSYTHLDVYKRQVMDNNGIKQGDVPMGLGMALAENLDALNYFASLSHEKQQRIIDHTHQIRSKQEMHSFVSHLKDSGY